MFEGGLLNFIKTPEGQGLLSAAFGGLAGARRGQPLNSLGRAGLAGLQGYGGALDRQAQEAESAFQKQFRTSQMEELQRKRATEQAQQAWRAGLPDVLKQAETTYGAGDEGPTMQRGNPQALQQYMMDPNSPFADRIMEQKLFPKAPDYLTVGKTVLRKDASGLTPAYKEPEEVDMNKLMIPDGKGGYMVNKAFYDAKAGIAAAGKPSISVDARNYNTQETEQSKVYGKTLGELRGAVTSAGFEAPKRLAQIDRMEELLKGVDGGKFAPAGAEIASAAESLGIKLDPKLGNKQAAEALAVQMALTIRPAGSGPMTDKDFENFLKTVPGLSKTPEGRAQISRTMRAAIQRDVETAKFARDYAKQNGGVIDDNFMDAVSDFYIKNPVVTPKMPRTNAQGSRVFDAADAILNRGRR